MSDMLIVCASIFSVTQLGVKLLDRFWQVISQKACLCERTTIT